MKVPSARWYRIGLLMFFLYLVAYMDRTNISMGAPSILKDLHMSTASIGLLLSFFFWGYVITQVPGGWLAGKISAKKVVIVGSFVWAIMSVLTGVVKNYDALLAVRFFMGLAEGVVFPAFQVLLVKWYPDRERARANSLLLISMPLSSAIMAPLAGWMIVTWNYHVMFIIQGILPIIVLIFFAIFMADSPAEDKLLSSEERKYLEQNRSTTEKEKGSLGEVLTKPRVWAFGLVYFFWINAQYGVGLWLPSFIKQLSHQGAMDVGWLTSIPYVLAVIAMIVNSALSDRFGLNRSWFVAVPLLIVGASLIVATFASGFMLSMILLTICTIGIYAAFGPWWAWAPTFVPRNQVGGAMGFINLCGNFGGITGPILIGLAAKGTDFTSGLYILGIFGILGFITILLTAKRLHLSAKGTRQSNSVAENNI